jgi:hypothetical protein
MSITKKMHVFARNNFLKLEIPNTKTDVNKDNAERINQESLISSNQNALNLTNQNTPISTNQNALILTNQNEADVNDLMFDLNIWIQLGKYISERDNK